MEQVLRYFQEEDILYIKTRPGRVHDQTLLDSDILLSYNKKGELVSIEVWRASKRGLTAALIGVAKRDRSLLAALVEHYNGKQPAAPEIEAE